MKTYLLKLKLGFDPIVSTLPIRNGNFFIFYPLMKNCGPVSTLPIRNGN